MSFQAQGQGFIPGPNIEYNFDEFDWQDFINEKSIQDRIDFRNQGFHYFGANINTLDSLNFNKLDLVRIEQELDLYELGLKEGLSTEEIQQAGMALSQHWENIGSIEAQIQSYAGFKAMAGGAINMAKVEPQVGNVADYINGVWELYQGDHEILFNMVEKTDKNLYEALGGNDEAYAKLILPQVEEYTNKMGVITQSYYDSLLSAYQGGTDLNRSHVQNLIDSYSKSLEVYNCFLKNFENPTGAYQQALKGTIQDWYGKQSELGAKALIESYRLQQGEELNPFFVVSKLNRFETEVPEGVKLMISNFYKNDIINNPDFINTEESSKLGARVDALTGLKYLGVLDEEGFEAERELFERGVNAGIIEQVDEETYFTFTRPLP